MSQNAQYVFPFINELLTVNGFEGENKSLYTRPKLSFTECALIDFNYDRGQDELVIGFGIRHNHFESMFHQWFPSHNEDFQTKATLVTAFKIFDLTIEKVQLKKLIQSHFQFVESDFLRRFVEEGVIESDVNQFPTKEFIHIPRNLKRIAIGLFLNKKLGRSNFLELKLQYESMLTNPKMKDNFQHLLNCL